MPGDKFEDNEGGGRGGGGGGGDPGLRFCSWKQAVPQGAQGPWGPPSRGGAAAPGLCVRSLPKARRLLQRAGWALGPRVCVLSPEAEAVKMLAVRTLGAKAPFLIGPSETGSCRGPRLLPASPGVRWSRRPFSLWGPPSCPQTRGWWGSGTGDPNSPRKGPPGPTPQSQSPGRRRRAGSAGVLFLVSLFL